MPKESWMAPLTIYIQCLSKDRNKHIIDEEIFSAYDDPSHYRNTISLKCGDMHVETASAVMTLATGICLLITQVFPRKSLPRWP